MSDLLDGSTRQNRRFACVAAIITAALLGIHGSEVFGGQEAALYAIDSDGARTWRLATLKDYPYFCSPEISPDGTRIAGDGWREGENNGDAHVLIVEIESGNVTDLGLGCMPTWSADGQWIGISKYGQGVFIHSLATSEERLIDENGWAIQWSPDGKKLAYTIGSQLFVYEVASDTKREVFAGIESPYGSIAHNTTWSPDSQKICMIGTPARGAPELVIVDISREKAKLMFCCPAGDLLPDIAWHPDGSRIVVPSNRGKLVVVAAKEHAAAPALLKGQPEDRSNGGLSWSRDGRTLIFVSYQAVAPKTK